MLMESILFIPEATILEYGLWIFNGSIIAGYIYHIFFPERQRQAWENTKRMVKKCITALKNMTK